MLSFPNFIFAYFIPNMSWYRLPSLYTLKMQRLSSKIFNCYIPSHVPYDIMTGSDNKAKNEFNFKLGTNLSIINRLKNCPEDLDSRRNPYYYPPHPQLRKLTHTLRLHGLFRDEHRDFVEEMKRLRELRGKQYRKLHSKGGKKAKLKDKIVK